MSDFEIDASDVLRFSSQMAQAPTVVRNELMRATDRLTLQGERFAKQGAPVKTGHLRRSIAHKPATFAGGTVIGVYGTATTYARPVEYGRRGFSAGPGRMLRFTVGGKTLYRKSVGPAAARPFMRPSVAKLKPLVPREYRAAMKRIAAALGMSS